MSYIFYKQLNPYILESSTQLFLHCNWNWTAFFNPPVNKENTSAVSILLCIRVKTLLDSCIVANSLGCAHLNRFKSLAGSCINMIDCCRCISIGNCMLIPGLSLQIWNLMWVISWLYCGLLYLSENYLTCEV